MTFEENGHYFIRGIVSLGPALKDNITGLSMCDPSHYAVFTDVAQYLPWIEAVTDKCEKRAECRMHT